MRVASLLPSATEMVFALGCGDQLVGVSHECDFPAQAQRLPKLVRNRFPTEGMSSSEIDERVAAALGRSESIYELDLQALRESRPDLVLTQALCDVCAVTGTDLQKALRELGLSPEIHEQTPTGLEGIFGDILRLGELLGAWPQAVRLVDSLRRRADRLRERTSRMTPTSIYCMEWLDPPYAAGHWVPEQAALAGGKDVLGEAGRPSRRIEWKEVARADPDAVVVAACGFTVQKTAQAVGEISTRPEWRALRAVREGRVWATDANAYFSRPGPRVIDGAELLAHLMHPGAFSWQGDPDAFKKL